MKLNNIYKKYIKTSMYILLWCREPCVKDIYTLNVYSHKSLKFYPFIQP